MLKPSVQSPPRSPQKSTLSDVQSKGNLKISVTSNPILVKSSFSDSPKLTDKSAPEVISAETSVMLKADPLKAVELKNLKKSLQPAPITTEKSPSTQVTTSATAERSISREATQVLPHSVSAAGRFGTDPSPATQSYVPQSLRNAIMGGLVSGSPVGFSQPHCPKGPERTKHSSAGPSSSYGMTNQDTSWNGQKCESSAGHSRSLSHPFVLNHIQDSDKLKPVNGRIHDHLPSELLACTSGSQSQSVLADEFPHLDIINDLLGKELNAFINMFITSN
ncbi:hypothetical protein BC332_15585 [Capsicum chinense]|nr:hypothetical protein BC332_15585 [Capsicum chinense]